MLQRLALHQLSDWAKNQNAKPLLLQGPRQVGKTWLMNELGRTSFDDKIAYFDFAKNRALSSIFEGDLDSERLIRELQTLTDIPIKKHETLIIFDEIQASDRAFASLKYFAQDALGYRIVAAGSLLGVAVRKRNLFVPVGKVEILHLSPLSFAEFLLNRKPYLYEYVQTIKSLTPLSDAVLIELFDCWQEYCAVGGMPEAVDRYLQTRQLSDAETILENILNIYRGDFTQYASGAEAVRIADVWNAIPCQLARGESKFFLSRINKNARSREYRPAVQWLEDSGLIRRLLRTSKIGIPLSAYADPDAFKIYLCDIGLLRILAQFSSDTILSGSTHFQEFKGALTENFIMNSLCAQLKARPAYFDVKGQQEIDFLIQSTTDIIPVEVKSGEAVRSASLKKYIAEQKPALAVRYSKKNLCYADGLLNIPLPLADWTAKLIGLTGNNTY